MKREAITLKVGVAEEDSAVKGLIEEILNQLGVPHTDSDLDQVPCLIGARRSAEETRPSALPRPDRTVYIDDFLSLDETLMAMQGRPEDSDGFYDEPELSTRARSFFDSIRKTFVAGGLPLVTKNYWPRDAPACLVLTHDIDWFSYSPFHRGVVRRKSFSRYLELILRYALGRRYGYNVDSMIALEAEFGVKSTFLFRTHYTSDAEKLPSAIKRCQASGCEVALHAARKSHKDQEAMKFEKSTMERTTGSRVAGLRQHALKFKYDKTWKCIESANFDYDMTFGLNEKTGFRAGLCHPYHPVGLEGRAYSLLEIPTSFMDWTAIHSKLDHADTEALLLRLIRTVLSLNGCLCVNFHNTYVDRDLFPEIERAYRLLISNCRAAGFWVATATECANWWVRRESAAFNVTMEDGSLGLAIEDPAVLPKIYWPDGRIELLGQMEYSERR